MMSTLEGQSLKHFRIEKLLGRGGMGVVYLGRDTRLDRPVAIKVLRPDLTANRERQSRFFQEARSAAAVRDDVPNGEFQQILRESGIVYVREDIVLKSKNSE